MPHMQDTATPQPQRRSRQRDRIACRAASMAPRRTAVHHHRRGDQYRAAARREYRHRAKRDRPRASARRRANRALRYCVRPRLSIRGCARTLDAAMLYKITERGSRTCKASRSGCRTPSLCMSGLAAAGKYADTARFHPCISRVERVRVTSQYDRHARNCR